MAVSDKNFYSFSQPDIDGQETSMAKFEGKTVLVVNVASKCGLTPQYEALESVYRKYKDRGFVVLGFPCNDFKEQEPGNEADIKAFCQGEYDVTFPMFSKLHVNGPDRHPMYYWLVEQTGGLDVEWNFGKFLVDGQGEVVKRWEPKTAPDAPEVTGAIEKVLGG